MGAFMQFFSLYDLYAQWETSGVFDFLLPALLIFSIIFGILTTTKLLGENKGISAVISMSIALMAMRLQIVSDFFSILLPGLGIGIAVIVVILIMAGLFMSQGNIHDWLPTFFWGGLVIGLIVVVSVVDSFAWFGSVWWQMNWVSIVWILIIVIVLLQFFRTPKSAAERKSENDMYGTRLTPARGQ